MSEQDDIFDIDDFLKKKVVPPYIRKAWKRHLKFTNQLELQAHKSSEVARGVQIIISALQEPSHAK